LALEVFEIDLTVLVDTKGMEHAVTDSVHQWDKLDRDLASNKFPHLREVAVSVHATLLHLDEKQRVDVEQKMMENFRGKLVRLHGSPLVAVNVKLVVRNDWL
jgi:hypothetical protein